MRLAGMSDEQARRFQESLVPIQYAGPLRVGEAESEAIAVLQLDTSARPDLADLARVIHSDGVQPQLSAPIYYVFSDDPAMILPLRMHDPVEIDATVVIPWSTYRDFFLMLRDKGRICILFGEIKDVDELATKSIVLHLRRAELDLALSIWQS